MECSEILLHELHLIRYLADKSFNSSFFLQYLDAFSLQPGCLCFVSEYLEPFEYSLSSLDSTLQIKKVADFSARTLSILAFLHSHKIIHADLKLDNFLQSKASIYGVYYLLHTWTFRVK
jgi:serine/threonine protein kinase